MTRSFNDTLLAFEKTVDNQAIQSWLLRIYSSLAIEELKQEASNEYSQAWQNIQNALNLMYQGEVHLEVLTRPELHLSIKVSDQVLNPSQLPEGMRNTLGWLLDFMLRQIAQGTTGGLLLIDEIDAHLHPKWQRTILPALRKALPDVQIIVTSHSPFVISSCPNSRVHVLERNQDGTARLKESIIAPFGNSLEAVLIDIFGVDSRFDVQTEHELREWDDLNKKRIRGQLKGENAVRFSDLTRNLAARSEELRAIVAVPLPVQSRKAR